MTLIILVLGLVAATCFIAYWADNLGKNLGKKRVSLKVGKFSLRPRQTATLISMASSVGIMLLTLCLLLGASKSIRHALLDYDVAVRAANQARREAEAAQRRAQTETKRARVLATALEKEIDSKRQAIAAFDQQLKKSQARLRDASTQLGKTRLLLIGAQQSKNAAQREASRAKNEAMRAQNEAARAAREVSSARSQTQQARARLVSARREFSTQRALLSRAQTQYRAAQTQLRVEQNSVDVAKTKLAAAAQKLGKTNGELASTQEQLDEAQGRKIEAQNRLLEAQSELAKMQDNFKRVEGEVNKTLAQLNETETSLAKKQSEFDELSREALRVASFTIRTQEVAKRLAYGAVAIREGDVFAEKTIAPKMSPIQARQALSDLLEAGRATLQASADQEADKDPNQKTDDDKIDASDAKISLSLVPLPIQISGQTVYLQGDEILTQLANYLSTFDTPVSVRLAAARAHAIGERKIDVRFFPVPVRTVFRQNEVLAQTSIPVGQGDARVFNQLLALMNGGEAQARGKGVNPVISEASPFFYAGGTNERIFEALRRIASLNAPARVKLVAARDLNTVEPLDVRIEVSRAENSNGGASASTSGGSAL